MRKIYLFAVLLLTVVSCGGGSSSSSSSSSGELGDADSLTGTVFAPNGIDPVAGATIYIPSSGSTMIVKNYNPVGKTVTGSDGSTTCDDPPETACAQTCSNADGTFTLDSSACPSTSTTLKIVKGTLAKTSTLDCAGTSCAVATGDTTFPSSSTAGAPTMAVVTGAYDHIEDVLAKLGFGSLDASGHFDKSQTFQFTLFDGDGTLDDSTYQNFSALLDGTVSMSTYDIIFINCGAHDSEDSTDLSNNDIQVRISEYIADGGKVYITDRAYDYIEQIYSGFLKFYGDSDDANVPGAIDAAEYYNNGGETPNATVNSDTLKSWLSAVDVIAQDASTPANPDTETCDGDYTTRTGALNPDDTIPIGGFLGGWAMIDSVHAGNGALSTTIWITADSSIDTRPLTASVDVGTNGGKIAYTSYHTAAECRTAYFWPQERILQYLIFETF